MKGLTVGPKQALVSPPVGSIFARVATGGSAVIMPAPPAGLMNIAVIAAHNADASAALSYRLTDADGGCVGPGAATQAANTESPMSTFAPLYCTTDLTASVSGAGTPCEFRGEYLQIPAPPGLLRGVLALTNAYQTIPNVVPATGISTPWKYVDLFEFPTVVFFNGDTATAVASMRLTRGGNAFVWTTSLSSVGGRNQMTVWPSLLPGDVFEAKLAAPPNVAGSIVLRAMYQQAQLAS